MILLIFLVSVNVLFLLLLQLGYVLISRRRLKISLLVEHLDTLAKSGLPIHSGLRAIARDLGGTLGLRIQRVAQGLEEGKTLGEAFDGAPRTFPPLLRNMLALGERSGNLTGFLGEMRRSYRRLANAPYQALYLFLYPLLISIGINFVLAGLFTGIVPKFATIFIQQELDPGSFMGWWPRLILANEVVLVLCILMTAFLGLGGLTPHFGAPLLAGFRRGVERLTLAVPCLGGLVRDGSIHQFAMAAGLFLRAGASLPEALRSAAEAERNGILRERLERAVRAVTEGQRLSAALRGDPGYREDLLWFVETGEASGLLADHLLLAAVHYETKVRLAARVAARSVVPAFVLLNGAIVFGSMALIVFPVQDLVQSAIRRLH